jgi:integrase
LSLYRVGEVWYIDVPSKRGRVRRSAGTTDKKAAQEYHDKIRQELWRQEKLGESPPVTWAAAVQKWLELKPRGLPDRYRIKSFGLDPSTTLPLSSETLMGVLPNSSAGSWNRSLALFVAIHNASGVSPPQVSRRSMPRGRTRWLSKEEWAKLQKVLLEESPLLEQAARFTLATGLRENNVLELEWPQVDLGRRVAWFYADQMKGRAEHGIPLNDAALAVLRERRGIHQRWVFGNPDYPLTKASNRAWYNALRRSKLKGTGVVWHTLRHTWASWAVMSGVRLEEVMKLGGWKTYSMVLRYAHLAPEHMAEAAAKVRPVSRLRHKGSLAQR